MVPRVDRDVVSTFRDVERRVWQARMNSLNVVCWLRRFSLRKRAL
jgi:uncharacterized protein (DUF4415 family)